MNIILNTYICVVFTIEDVLEGYVALESWLEWDLKPTEQSGHKFNLNSESTFYGHSNFISLFSLHILFRSLPLSVATFTLSEILHR